jgi:hypothetical protein
MDTESREKVMIDTSLIPGYGVDADPSRRPGIPREREPRPEANASLGEPQRSDIEVLVHPRPFKTLPPVYGTAQPPRGASGALRRVAYGYPDHWARHWMLLLLADRVDVVEHRLRSPQGLAALALLAVGGSVAVGMARRRRSRLRNDEW